MSYDATKGRPFEPLPMDAKERRGGDTLVVGDARITGARSFEVLYSENITALKAFLQRKLHHEEDVEDTLQELYLRLHGIPEDVVVSSPRAFMFKIAANLAIDLLRQRQRQNDHGAGAHALDVHEHESLLSSGLPSPEQVALSRESAEQALRTLEQLSAKTKRVFMMHRFEEMSYARIASELKVTVKAVEYHMTQALLNLRMKQDS